MPAPRTGILLLASAALLACANRGMQAPSGQGGAGAGAGIAGGAGSGGAAGGAGTGGSSSCTTPSPHDAGGACNAMFNFETGVQGANVPATGQAAFTAVTASGDNTFCGSGALAIAASFSGTMGATTKGIVELPIDPANMDFTGKTLTVHVSALPGCSADLGFAVVLRTGSGSETVVPTERPIGADWKTLTVTLAGDAGTAGEASVLAISLQAFSSTDYTGTIYVDEVDVR